MSEGIRTGLVVICVFGFCWVCVVLVYFLFSDLSDFATRTSALRDCPGIVE